MAKPAKALTAADLERKIQQTSDCRDPARSRIIAMLNFKADLRAAEIAGSKWRIHHSAYGQLFEHLSRMDRIAQRGSSRRTPINAELCRLLLLLRRMLTQPTQSANIFSARGSHMTPRSIVSWSTGMYRELGFSGCSSRSGRLTFITQIVQLLSRAVGSIRDIWELANCRSLTMTKQYTGGDRGAQRTLVQLF